VLSAIDLSRLVGTLQGNSDVIAKAISTIKNMDIEEKGQVRQHLHIDTESFLHFYHHAHTR
jgi:hypothetical protein